MLRNSHKDSQREVIRLETTISNQSKVIVDLCRDLEWQKQLARQQTKQLEAEKIATATERETTATEIQKLKAAHKENETSVDKLKQENQSLEGNVEALIDMSIKSNVVGRGYAEENKKLSDQTAILSRELELIRGVLMNQLSGLMPNLSNLSAVLNSRSSTRRNPRRRARKSARETT